MPHGDSILLTVLQPRLIGKVVGSLVEPSFTGTAISRNAGSIRSGWAANSNSGSLYIRESSERGGNVYLARKLLQSVHAARAFIYNLKKELSIVNDGCLCKRGRN